MAAVVFSFFAGICLKSIAVLFHFGKGSVVCQQGDLDAVRRRGAGKIAQLALIRSGDQDALH